MNTGFFYYAEIYTLAIMNVPVFSIEVISFLASFALFFQVATPSYLRMFTVFLFITIVIEYTAVIMESHKMDLTPIYNFFTAFEFEFYFLMTWFIIRTPKVKKVIGHLLWIYPSLVILNLSTIQRGDFHTITYSLGCLILVTASIFYFLEMFRSPSSVDLVREPTFWICTALLFYYTCTFTLVGLWNQLHGLPLVIINNVTNILTILNILLYSMFSIAFLCRIKIKSFHLKFK